MSAKTASVNRGGRPTKLTPELADAIIESVRAGNYLETAAALHGLSYETVRAWAREGERATGGLKHRFSAALKSASADAEATALKVITEAGKEHWQAMAWRLERRYPKKWALRVVHHVEDALKGVIARLEVEFAKEPGTMDRILEAIAREDEDGAAAEEEA